MYTVMNIVHDLITVLEYMYVVCYTSTLLCLSSDPTLTTHNVTEMVKGVDYMILNHVLNGSYNKWREIYNQYQSDEQRSEALVAHVVLTHPCLTWKRLSTNLQGCGYSEAATEVTRKYVKG